MIFEFNLLAQLFFLIIVLMIIIVLILYSSYIRCMISRCIRIIIRQRCIDPNGRRSKNDTFSKFFRNYLCNLQKTNNELLGKILRDHHSCAFLVDRSISYLSGFSPKTIIDSRLGYSSIDEFRERVPLTTYADYAPYINRMVNEGEKNLLSKDDVLYYAASSGTTANIKLLPTTGVTLKKMTDLLQIGWSIVWRSFPSSSYPSSEQRLFYLTSAKKSSMFPRSSDQTPIGPISQFQCIVSPVAGMKLVVSAQNVISLDFLQEISHFETSLFVQLVFAVAIPDIISYTVPFAPGFLHTIKIIQSYYEEISLCISTADFDSSSLVQANLPDDKFRASLNEALHRMSLEYGGLQYRLQRAQSIRHECMKKDAGGLLHRLWPQMVYAATTTGSSFAMYKDEIKSFCGDQLTLINLPLYAASEGFFGVLASIHTDEYILSPTSAFFEFIREEDIHEVCFAM
jgi:hypothetical protein